MYHVVGHQLVGFTPTGLAPFEYPQMATLRARTHEVLAGRGRAAWLPSKLYSNEEWDTLVDKSITHGMGGMTSEAHIRGAAVGSGKDIIVLNWEFVMGLGSAPGHRTVASLFPNDLSRVPHGRGLGVQADTLFSTFPSVDDLVDYVLHDAPVKTPFGGFIPARGSRQPPIIIVYDGSIHFDSTVVVAPSLAARATHVTPCTAVAVAVTAAAVGASWADTPVA
jgi:hypothetical protein